MRGALVSQGNRGARVCLAFGLAFDQGVQAARHQIMRLGLAGDNVRKILDRAGEVGDLFFEPGDGGGGGLVCHGGRMRLVQGGVNGSVLPLSAPWVRPRASDFGTKT